MRKTNNLTDERIERLVTDSMGVKSQLSQPVKEKTLRLLKDMVSINSQKSSNGFPNPILIILSSGMVLINMWVLMSFISSRIRFSVFIGSIVIDSIVPCKYYYASNNMYRDCDKEKK